MLRTAKKKDNKKTLLPDQTIAAGGHPYPSPKMVMRGQSMSLDCYSSGHHDYYIESQEAVDVLAPEWFLVCLLEDCCLANYL